MSLNALEIGMVSEILHRDLRGAAAQEFLSPALENRVVIRLRSPGVSHLLEITLAAGATRIGRIAAKPRVTHRPHPFVMLLRKALTGLRLEQVVALGGDRVVSLDFSKGERKGRLVCELTSRHANIFLIQGPDNLITGSFFPNRSHLRKLVPGEPYQQPFTRPLAGEVKNRFDMADDPEADIAAHYQALEAAERERTVIQGVRRLLTRAERRMKRLVKNLKGDLARAEEAKTMAHLGHVLKANLHAVKKGQIELRAVDFEGAEVVIPLDPKLGPVANMEQLFKKAKRFDKATDAISARLEKVKSHLLHLGSLKEAVETADAKQLEEMRKTVLKRHPFLNKSAPGKKGALSSRLPYREFVISSGRRAMVGRSARDNDTLTLKHAGPFDLWLHVRGGTGSHVVVPMGRGEEPGPELLVDAAHLAAHYSTFKDDADVEVLYTRRRYVQKPKGAPPGSVRLLKEKTMKLRVEPARLKRILTP
jgi:predicted ribosome quality control (RQC) complex YloA/Tae2 family protein